MSSGKIGNRSLTADCNLKFHGKQQSTLMAQGIFSLQQNPLGAGLRLAQKKKKIIDPFSSETNGVIWKHMKSPNDTFKALLARNVTEM